MDTYELAKKIAEEALETKAKDLKVLDLQKLVSYTDYFVLATATSDRHSQAIADRVYAKIKKDLGRLPISYEGHSTGQWVLLDYGDVVLHIFLPEQREFYALDQLWSDATVLPIGDGKKKILKIIKPSKPAVKKRTPSKSKSKSKAKIKSIRKPPKKKKKK